MNGYIILYYNTLYHIILSRRMRRRSARVACPRAAARCDATPCAAAQLEPTRCDAQRLSNSARHRIALTCLLCLASPCAALRCTELHRIALHYLGLRRFASCRFASHLSMMFRRSSTRLSSHGCGRARRGQLAGLGWASGVVPRFAAPPARCPTVRAT